MFRVQRASWVDARRDFGTRSSISQCFTCKYRLLYYWYLWTCGIFVIFVTCNWTGTRCFPCSCCGIQDACSKITRVSHYPHSSFRACLQLLGLQTCKNVVLFGVRLLELCLSYLLLNQISESLKRCGISDSTTYILAARFGASSNEVRPLEWKLVNLQTTIFFVKWLLFWQMTAIKGLIKGTEIGLEELETRADRAQIHKVCSSYLLIPS